MEGIYIQVGLGLFFLVLNIIVYKKNVSKINSVPKIEYTDKGVAIRNKDGEIVINGDKVI